MPHGETTDITQAWHVLAFKKIDNSLTNLRVASDVPHIGIAKQSAPGALDAASPSGGSWVLKCYAQHGCVLYKNCYAERARGTGRDPFQESP